MHTNLYIVKNKFKSKCIKLFLFFEKYPKNRNKNNDSINVNKHIFRYAIVLHLIKFCASSVNGEWFKLSMSETPAASENFLFINNHVSTETFHEKKVKI